MKAGDKVVVVKITNNSKFFRHPKLKTEIVEITGYCKCGCNSDSVFELSGYEYGLDGEPIGFDYESLRLVDNKGQSTSASRSLVKTLHVEKIGTNSDKYLEEERELVLDAKF